MTDDQAEELDARINALRMIIAVLLYELTDPLSIAPALVRAEKVARSRNMHAATIEEIRAIRLSLDDM